MDIQEPSRTTEGGRDLHALWDTYVQMDLNDRMSDAEIYTYMGIRDCVKGVLANYGRSSRFDWSTIDAVATYYQVDSYDFSTDLKLIRYIIGVKQVILTMQCIIGEYEHGVFQEDWKSVTPRT